MRSAVTLRFGLTVVSGNASCYKEHEVAVLYLERNPARAADPFIRALWYARGAGWRHRRERILPNGCVQVILNLARDFLLDCPEGEADRRMPPR